MGTGLGLSMVHGLAEQLGGRLQLQSRLGAGTTASLWLPSLKANAQGAIPVAAATAAVADLTPLAILAVDDDALVLMNTAAMLEDLGHRVSLAYSGKEALDKLRSHTFDLLVTDQGMPGMTGAELIGHVRAELPTLPIILATAYAEMPPGVASDVLRLGKPFLQDQLLGAVARAMTRR
jgi:CheY-like chemotaxis protein